MKNNICKITFLIFLGSFTILYFSNLTGYYQYQNHENATYTKEQIEQFENDVSSGNAIDITEYLSKNNIAYDNKLSRLANNMSNIASSLVKVGVKKTFKLISKFMD